MRNCNGSVKIHQHSRGLFTASTHRLIVERQGEVEEWEAVRAKGDRFNRTITCGDETLAIRVINTHSKWLPLLIVSQYIQAEHNGYPLFQFKSRWLKNYIRFPNGEECSIEHTRRGLIILKKIRFLFASRNMNFCVKRDEFRVADEHIPAGLCLAMILWELYADA